MNLGIFFKYIRSLILHRSICRNLKAVPSKYCVILTYHRILPKDEVTDSVEPGMYVTPSTLRDHIRYIKRYFEIVTLQRLEELVKRKQIEKSLKPRCVITFDDGWIDFYTYAWPILRDEEVPAVVYLPTNLIGTEKSFWTDRLARVLEKSDVNLIGEHIGCKIKCGVLNRNSSPQRQLKLAIDLLKDKKYQQIEKLLCSCEDEVGIVKLGELRSFMNWEEVLELFSTGLISFGSHTVNHAILTTLPNCEIQVELHNSKEKLIEKKVASDNIPFCYPNGNYTKEIKMLVAKCGFSSAVTCLPGWNKVGDDLFELRRISLHQDISSSKPLFAFRLTRSQ